MTILVDERTAVVTPEEFEALPEYSCSIPTGKTVGKRWKCKVDYYDASAGWLLREYAEDTCHPDSGYLLILTRELLVA